MSREPGSFRPAPIYGVADPVADQSTRIFLDRMGLRRSVRSFSPQPVPIRYIQRAIETAATAPSGANSQPWRFVVVSDPETKRRLRAASEANERVFYDQRATPAWLTALEPIGTDWSKPFFEEAPVLIAVFEVLDEAPRKRSFYAKESVGIAVGLLLASLHLAGLATLTYTSSPFRWLNSVLDRPSNEHPFALIPVGHPAEGALVPDLARKPLDEVMVLHEGARSWSN